MKWRIFSVEDLEEYREEAQEAIMKIKLGKYQWEEDLPEILADWEVEIVNLDKELERRKAIRFSEVKY
jgi:hypothetical protein